MSDGSAPRIGRHVDDSAVAGWRRALASQDATVIAQAMYEIGESRARVLGEDVLRAAEHIQDEHVTEQAVWALGKIAFAPATNVVIHASRRRDRGLLRAAFWALGELGGPDAERRLVEADKENIDPGLGKVIGGALKKLRSGTVRVPAAVVARRLRAPDTTDPRARRILDALEAPGLGHSDIVRLREELQGLDPELFGRYMAYVRDRKRLGEVLTSDAVYRDEFDHGRR